MNNLELRKKYNISDDEVRNLADFFYKEHFLHLHNKIEREEDRIKYNNNLIKNIDEQLILLAKKDSKYKRLVTDKNNYLRDISSKENLINQYIQSIKDYYCKDNDEQEDLKNWYHAEKILICKKSMEENDLKRLCDDFKKIEKYISL